ncbi:MAG: tRNA (adenosine(37)-N6)-dimethylallyltransferase MiaA [Lachnospiraceae bacterium]|nr:tRNA (adenosine(37)-N6)-dimethylallyltransferase MiaA [Lachnospiraceae bacterium]
MESENRLIILTGPTAVGKTALSIRLAKRIKGEIVSADSMQVYKHMDIGSAKITGEEMDGVPHHLINILEPDEEFNVFRFKSLAREALKGIYGRGHIPILTGGTGFYIQALLYDIDFSSEEDHSLIRARLEETGREKGSLYLHARLMETDPASAESIHPNNLKRIIRALEFYQLTGTPISAHNQKQREKKAFYNACYFVLNDHRDTLYRKIEKRVDEMMEAGLVAEVESLRKMGCCKDMVSMQGLGYKEILSCLEGDCTLEEAVALIKRDTRRFAKRQLTWFRRERDVIWVNKPDFAYDDDRILDFMMEHIERMDRGHGQE